MSLYVADAKSRTDGSAYQMLEKVSSNIPIVLVAWTERFKFNPDLLKLKDYVLVCFCEYGYDFKIIDSHIWGENSEKFTRYYTGDWVVFDNWVKENPPKLLFKRELLQKDVTSRIKPIEYACRYSIPPAQTKESFDGRPIQAMMYWGRSNERRLGIHGGIWVNAMKKGYSVIDSVYYFEKFLMEESGIKWATFNIPHYSRIPMEQLLVMNGYSKIGISPSGAGNKCFRETEVSVNSVLCMHDTGMAYSFDWVDGVNCIKMPIGTSDNCTEEIEAIEAGLRRDDLYEIYLKCIDNCKNYQFQNYISNYIEPIINSIV